jgi:hypothetical protein
MGRRPGYSFRSRSGFEFSLQEAEVKGGVVGADHSALKRFYDLRNEFGEKRSSFNIVLGNPVDARSANWTLWIDESIQNEFWLSTRIPSNNSDLDDPCSGTRMEPCRFEIEDGDRCRVKPAINHRHLVAPSVFKASGPLKAKRAGYDIGSLVRWSRFVIS